MTSNVNGSGPMPFPRALQEMEDSIAARMKAMADRAGGEHKLCEGGSFFTFLKGHATEDGKRLLKEQSFWNFTVNHLTEESKADKSVIKGLVEKIFGADSRESFFEKSLANALDISIESLSPEQLQEFKQLAKEEADILAKNRVRAFLRGKSLICSIRDVDREPHPKSLEFARRVVLSEVGTKRCGEVCRKNVSKTRDRLAEKQAFLSSQRDSQKEKSALRADIQRVKFAKVMCMIEVARQTEKSMMDLTEDDLKRYDLLLEQKIENEKEEEERLAKNIRDELLLEDDARKADNKSKKAAVQAAPSSDEVIIKPSKSDEKKQKVPSKSVILPTKVINSFVEGLNIPKKEDRCCAWRVLRWGIKDENLDSIMSFDPPKYVGCNKQTLRLIRDCHYIRYIERLCRPDVVKEYGYSYLYVGSDGSSKTGIVFFAVKTTEGQAVEGLIHVGVDANEVIYHSDFQPLENKPISVQTIAPNLDEGVLKTLEGLRASVDVSSGEFAEKTGWQAVGGGASFFAGSRPGSIDLRVSEFVTFSVYRLKYS